jgi:NodT family efflux transporter outer membrane factor (OMF) lipoprotein
VSVSNQTIQKAVAQLQEARAMVESAHAAYLPTVGVEADGSRLHDSQYLFGHQQTAGKSYNDYAVALDASWEPDLWGKIAHENDAARAGAQASAADLESVRLGVHAELAVDYFNLRGLDASKQLLDQTIADYQQTLDLTKSRFTVGVSSQSDVTQAETQLQATEAQDIDLGVARAQYEHAIATLTGVPASTFTLPPATADFTPPAIPVGLPSELLQRRPDIAAAERLAAAANDQIGIAESAFFPDLVLSATGGLESSSLTNWLTAPARMWTIGPALVGTLFDGGRRRAMTEKARAQYDASAADYRQTVLTAFQEVEDNLASLRILQQEASKQDEAVASAKKTLQLELDQYRIGTVGYLEVVTAQSTALANERTAVDLERRQMDASVLLVKALGGIW